LGSVYADQPEIYQSTTSFSILRAFSVKHTILDHLSGLHSVPLLQAGCRLSSVQLKHISKTPRPWDQRCLQSRERRYLRATMNCKTKLATMLDIGSNIGSRQPKSRK
jgi:uncharacterized phage-associated protein